MALRDQVHRLCDEARTVLLPQQHDLDVQALERTFVIRANDGFVECFATKLIAAVAGQAPGVRLRFAPKPSKDAAPLREGMIDLEIGVRGASAP